MSVGINIPKRQQSNQNSNLLSLAGAGAGAAFGGPAGASLGLQAGGMVGGMAQDKSQGPQAVELNAMQRRQSELDNSAQRQIAQSIDSLKYIEDPAQRIELGKPLVMAQMQAQKGGQYGG